MERREIMMESYIIYGFKLGMPTLVDWADGMRNAKEQARIYEEMGYEPMILPNRF